MTGLLHGLAFLLGLGVLTIAVGLIVNIFGERGRRRRQGPHNQPSAYASIKGRMRRAARSTLLLVPTTEATLSKLGGTPALPPGATWPRSESGPRAFVAQVDLAEVRDGGGPEWLPAEGRLYAFCDPTRLGFGDLISIIHATDPAGEPRAPPPELSAKWQFPERRVAFLQMTSTPSLDWLGVDVREVELGDEELDELADAHDEPFGDELQHRIGGYPSEIQDADMAMECEHLARGLPMPAYEDEVPPAIARASKSWRLLLQIDSDPALKMNWGNGGRLYVFVRQKHAEAGNFSRTVTLSQSY